MWTKEQNDAIMMTGNLLVSAAAGAGKTAVLTERIVRNIMEGARVDELLVVSFTRLASEEMKQRIERRLSELASACDDAQTRRRLEAAAEGVYRANISTIHGFCKNLLKRSYDRVGLDPAFKTLDNAEAELLFAQATEETVEELYLSAERERDEASLILIDAVSRKEELFSLLKGIYSFIMARPDPRGWLDGAIKKCGEDFDKVFDAASSQLISLAKRDISVFHASAGELKASGVLSENDTLNARLCELLDRDMEELLELSSKTVYEHWHTALLDFKLEALPVVRGSGGAPKSVKAYREGLKKLIEKLQKMFSLSRERERLLAERSAPVIARAAKLTEELIERYSALKQEMAAVDFNDLEQLSLRALSEDAVAEEYREKFRFIFVDEYQDTNLVQDSIITKISRGNNVFMVGDVKQSIYRFRQAEPGIFLEKYLRYDGTEGTRIDLNRNFRSETAVLSAANALFSKLMLGEVGEIDYRDNAALHSRDGAGKGEVELALIELSEEEQEDAQGEAEDAQTQIETDEADGADDGKDEEGELRELENIEAEGAFVAEKIRELIANARIRDGDGERRLRYSDFAVLLRVTSRFALRMVNALSERGIPCSAELGDGYFDAIEVRIFIDLLRVIDNARQDIPLAAVLRSSIGGFGEAELAHIKSRFEGECFWDRLRLAAEGGEEGAAAEKARRFVDLHRRMRQMSRLVGVFELIGTLLDETRFYTYVGAMPGGEVRRANLELLLEKARSFEEGGGRGLYSFIRLLDGIRENTRLGAAEAGAQDAVRVMSIHKSKGLEFPVVFICSLTGSFSRRDSRSAVMLERELGIGLRLGRARRRLSGLDAQTLLHADKPLVRRAIEARDESKLVSEEMRVLYVAMTRAKSRLYLVGALKGMAKFIEKHAAPLSNYRIMSAGCYLEWILGAFFPLGLAPEAAARGLSVPVGEDGLFVRLTQSLVGENADVRIKKEAFHEWLERVKGIDRSEMDARLAYRYPFLEDTKTSAKTAVTDALAEAAEYVPAVPSFLRERGGRGLSAAERGTATHRFISLIPPEALSLEQLQKMLDSFRVQGHFSEDEARAVDLYAAKTLIASPLYTRLLASKKIRREQEFSLLNANGTLTQGVVDCCFEEDGGLVLIDYKTTALKGETAERVAAGYKPQLDAYAAALERLTGLPVREKWVYLLSVGKACLVE